jgi:hypothetical protein
MILFLWCFLNFQRKLDLALKDEEIKRARELVEVEKEKLEYERQRAELRKVKVESEDPFSSWSSFVGHANRQQDRAKELGQERKLAEIRTGKIFKQPLQWIGTKRDLGDWVYQAHHSGWRKATREMNALEQVCPQIRMQDGSEPKARPIWQSLENRKDEHNPNRATRFRRSAQR